MKKHIIVTIQKSDEIKNNNNILCQAIQERYFFG